MKSFKSCERIAKKDDKIHDRLMGRVFYFESAVNLYVEVDDKCLYDVKDKCR